MAKEVKKINTRMQVEIKDEKRLKRRKRRKKKRSEKRRGEKDKENKGKR
jgi:hypothetical protein